MSGLLIFDYDGTLNDTMAIYRPAVLKVAAELRERYQDKPAPMPDEGRIRGWIGMRTEDMWRDYRPDLPVSVRRAAAGQGGRLMEELMERQGRWYPGAAESLDELKAAGHCMIVLSSCTRAYARAHWARFDMGRRFSAFLACDDYPEPEKARVLELLLRSPGRALASAAVCPDIAGTEGAVLGRDAAVMLGDRAYDASAASENGIAFIACSYGFGDETELHGAAFAASSPRELSGLASAALAYSRA